MSAVILALCVVVGPLVLLTLAFRKQAREELEELQRQDKEWRVRVELARQRLEPLDRS
jgi:lipopolysaccharide biosynthesis regulator YciM